MLEQFSQLEIKDWLKGLIDALQKSRLPMPEGWRPNFSDDPIVITEKGLIIVKWRESNSTDRLKATFSYRDGDGEPFVSLVFDKANVLQEVEVWRGDGEPLVYAPTINDLEFPRDSS